MLRPLCQTVKEPVSHRRIPGEKCERGAMSPHFRVEAHIVRKRTMCAPDCPPTGDKTGRMARFVKLGTKG